MEPVQQQEVWDEAKQIYIYTKGDQSVLIFTLWCGNNPVDNSYDSCMERNLKSAYKAECIQKAGMHVNTFAEDLKSFLHENLYRLFMTPTGQHSSLCLLYFRWYSHDLYGIY